jgi:hypothetical protein
MEFFVGSRLTGHVSPRLPYSPLHDNIPTILHDHLSSYIITLITKIMITMRYASKAVVSRYTFLPQP